MKIISHRHTGLIVNDLDKMLDFYLGLGFELRRRDIEEGSFINNLVGEKNIKLETAKLILNNKKIDFQYRFQLELIFIFNTKKNLRNKGNFNFKNCYGLVDLSFTVDKIDEFINFIVDKGGKQISKPSKSPEGYPALHSYCCDPEGNVLHLAENLK